MQRGLPLQLAVCLSVLSFCLYSYQSKQNELTHLKIRLPQLEKEIGAICEEAQRLQFEIERGEGPSRLIQLAHQPEFRHLKHPLLKEVLTVREGIAVQTDKPSSVHGFNNF